MKAEGGNSGRRVKPGWMGGVRKPQESGAAQKNKRPTQQRRKDETTRDQLMKSSFMTPASLKAQVVYIPRGKTTLQY